MFKLFSNLHPRFVKQNLTCLLCGQQRAWQYQCCRSCWQGLPWHNGEFTRYDVTCRAALYYDFPINKIVQRFKDQAQFEYADFLLGCLLTLPKPRVQAIVPMPLSTVKLIQRGYNQSVWLAQALARQWQIPVWQPFDRQASHSQRGLSRQERLTNVEGLFIPNHQAQRNYRHVLMLDDVITTGASLHALQQQLSQLGCVQIQALCVCDAAHHTV